MPKLATKMLLELADAIESESVCQFTMQTYFIDTPCKTAGCIAGTAIAKFMPISLQPENRENLDYIGTAAILLGLSPTQAIELFIPSAVPWQRVSPSQAADVIRHLAKTGQVDWTQHFPLNY